MNRNTRPLKNRRDRYRREAISIGLQHHHAAQRAKALGVKAHGKVLTMVLEAFVRKLEGKKPRV